jgi:hypothetical protein
MEKKEKLIHDTTELNQSVDFTAGALDYSTHEALYICSSTQSSVTI